MQNSPEGINVGGSRKRKLALIVTRAHFAHDLWCEITNPTVRELQLVLSSRRHFKKEAVH